MTHDTPVSAESLAGIAMFRTLALPVREHIASLARGQRFAAGQQILGYDEPSREVYFIVSGSVRVTHCTAAGKEITFRNHGAGEMFGELSAIDGQARSAHVHAVQDSFLLALREQAFRTLLAEHPTLTAAVLSHLAALVRALSKRVIEYSALHVAQRVRAELLRLAQADRADPRRGLLEPVPTHAEIASLVSTHREAVSRELAALSRAGLIERHGTALLIPDLDKLRAISEVESNG